MHIVCNKAEAKKLIYLKLPKGTTIAECHRDIPVFMWVVEGDNSWRLTEDIAENDRRFTAGEEEMLEEKCTKDKAVAFFTDYDVDTRPYREFTFYSDKIRHYFDYVRKGCFCDPETKRSHWGFSIGDVKEVSKASKEVTYIIPKIKVPSSGIIFLDVMENTCSEYGAYGVDYHVDTGEFIFHITVYGKREDILTSTNIKDILTYVAKNHPYSRN